MLGIRDRLRGALGPYGTAAVKRKLAPLVRRDLSRLGRWYGTDKAFRHGYTAQYQRHLAHLRRKPVRLLEVGIGGYDGGLTSGGSSLRMWRTWMPRASIVGLDLDPRDFREPRITTYAGDQSDADFLRWLEAEAGPFHVVIDDGSHQSPHIVRTFETLWPLLEPGGVYIIEDLFYSYDSQYRGGPPGTRGTSMELVKEFLDLVPRKSDVAGVAVYEPGAAIIHRAGDLPPLSPRSVIRRGASQAHHVERS